MTNNNRQYTLEEACNILGYSDKELAKVSGVSLATIRRITSGSNIYGVQVTTALLLASALGLQVNELVFTTGLSPFGRPAATGKPIVNPGKKLHIECCPIHGYEHHSARPCPQCANEL